MGRLDGDGGGGGDSSKSLGAGISKRQLASEPRQESTCDLCVCVCVGVGGVRVESGIKGRVNLLHPPQDGNAPSNSLMPSIHPSLAKVPYRGHWSSHVPV